MTEAIFGKPDEPSSVFLLGGQKLWVLKFDLILKAITKFSDGAYVMFHLLLVYLLHAIPSLFSIDQSIVVIRLVSDVVPSHILLIIWLVFNTTLSCCPFV